MRKIGLFVLFMRDSICIVFLGDEDQMNKNLNKERRDAKMTMLYELRLMIAKDKKTEYTKEEIAELIDKIVVAKK